MTRATLRLVEPASKPDDAPYGDYRDFLYRHRRPLPKVERSSDNARPGELVQTGTGWDRIKP